MDLDAALAWVGEHRTAVLITLRADGRAQSSDVAIAVDGGEVLVSVTADRAKSANMARDPRVVLHVTDPPSWSYVSIDAVAHLSDVTTAVDDDTSDRLVHYYRLVAGEHPDWDEYRQAMVDERRLVARLAPRGAVGQIN